MYWKLVFRSLQRGHESNPSVLCVFHSVLKLPKRQQSWFFVIIKWQEMTHFELVKKKNQERKCQSSQVQHSKNEFQFDKHEWKELFTRLWTASVLNSGAAKLRSGQWNTQWRAKQRTDKAFAFTEERKESFWHKHKKPDEHFVFNRNKREVVHNSVCSLGVKLLPFSRVSPMAHKSKSWKQNEIIHLSDGHLSCWEQCRITSYIPEEGILRKQT